MNCIKCSISVFKTTLHRTKAIGQTDAGWMCLKCIKLTEPELAKNITSDDNSVLGVLEEATYGTKKTK